MKKAFLLDRDGTINLDTGYVMSADDVVLLKGVGEAIQKIRKNGYLIIVISNQSGIARGYGTVKDVQNVNKKINELLLKEFQTEIDAFYYCPHHPMGIVKKYKIECNCRKPKVGLFKQAIKEWDLEPSLCIAAGDKSRDIEELNKLNITKTAIINEKDGEYKSLLEYVDMLL